MQSTELSPTDLSPPTPGPRAWIEFLERTLTYVGTALVVAGVIFFFAANWQDLGRFSKFALLEVLLAGAAIAAWRLGIHRLPGQVALTAAAMLSGALIALYGQTYQTGADAWENFAIWAVLILPWAMAARFPALWLIWLGVVDLALLLFGEDVLPRESRAWMLVAVAVVDVGAWIIWENARRRGKRWLDTPWGPRLIAVASFLVLLGPSLQLLWDRGEIGQVPAIIAFNLLLVTIAATIAFYWRRERRPDMLALALATAVTLLTNVVAWALDLDFDHSAPYFIVGLFLIFEVWASAWWLRRISREEVTP